MLKIVKNILGINNSSEWVYIKPEKKVEKKCLCCDKVVNSYKYKFCSNKCQSVNSIRLSYEKIEGGDTTLGDHQYKRYLIFKNGNKCMECGWCEVNKTTGNVPIQLEHIDGNSKNNNLDNLKLLCPNCHSLTSTYGSLNKGNGRSERQKYRESLKKKTIEELLEERKRIN